MNDPNIQILLDRCVTILLILLGTAAAMHIWRHGYTAIATRKIAARFRQTAGPYKSKPPLTQGETAFFLALHHATDRRFHIFAKIRLADIADSPAGKPFYDICSKHIDFLICDLASLQPIVAIELDDKSHLTQKAQTSDQFKKKFFETIGIPLKRIRAQHAYAIDELRSLTTR